MYNETCQNGVTHYVHENTLFFEKYHRPELTHRWIERNSTLVYYVCALYVITIFSIQRAMQNRKPFRLKGCLVFWNFFLTFYNLAYLLRMLPECYHALFNNGVHYAICDSSHYLSDEAVVTNFWTMLLLLSKMLEFGDTIFIVLRKQPLIFLHWYHHIMTLIAGWRGYMFYESVGRICTTMNTFVHVIMYLYYALLASGFTSVRRISPMVTFIQIVQMFIGCAIVGYVWSAYLSETACDVTLAALCIAAIMYSSYLIMFCRFFYYSYCIRRPKQTVKSSSKTD